MYNHNKAQQSKNRVHISWDILYAFSSRLPAHAQRQSISQGDRPTHECIRAIKWDALPYHVRVSGAG